MQNYQPNDNFLQDKVILVTGATDGIGKEVAIEYANMAQPSFYSRVTPVN